MSLTVAMDSGAIIGLSRGDRRAIAILQYYRTHGAFFIVPAPVLAETLRGGKADAAARLGATDSRATVDAMIVAVALQAGATDIVTSDPADLSTLAQREIRVVSISMAH